MSDHGSLHLVLTDDTIRRALRPAPEVAAPADFASTMASAISNAPQRRSFWSFGAARRSSAFRLVGQLLILMLLLLALIIGAIFVGSLRELPSGGGPLFVAQGNELSMIDPQTNRLTPIATVAGDISGVSRSADGEFVSFWTGSPPTSLELARTDGSGRRRLATNLVTPPTYEGGTDVWSVDGRFLASGVAVDGIKRILVVDVGSGDGYLIGPHEGADSPLWSPDGNTLAFAYERAGHRVLAVMQRDGSGVRDITAGLAADVGGPDNWSSDGRWIYFDAGQRSLESASVYRVDVETNLVERLTHGQASAAPALSPDDRQIAFVVWTFARNDTLQSIFVMEADGSRPHLLIEDADTRGWSPDGRYVLVVAYPAGEPVQLMALAPDGSERKVLLSLDSCPDPCLTSLSWGWPRP